MKIKSGRIILSKQVGKIADGWPIGIDGLLVKIYAGKIMKSCEVEFRFSKRIKE